MHLKYKPLQHKAKLIMCRPKMQHIEYSGTSRASRTLGFSSAWYSMKMREIERERFLSMPKSHILYSMSKCMAQSIGQLKY